MTFAILARVPGGPTGSVTLTTSPGTARYHMVITGLTPGSSHAVHDHLGVCSSAATSEHLLVVATARADDAGTVIIDTSVRPPAVGTGRIILVYSSPTPTLITGCADL